MAIAITTAIRDIAAAAAINVFGGGDGRLSFYTGTRPATPAHAAAPESDEIARFTLGNPVLASTANGIVTLTTPAQVLALAPGGEATWWRMWKNGQTAPASAGQSADFRIDGNASSELGTGDIKFTDRETAGDGNDWVTGGAVSVNISFNMPAVAP